MLVDQFVLRPKCCAIIILTFYLARSFQASETLVANPFLTPWMVSEVEMMRCRIELNPQPLEPQLLPI